MLRPTVLPRYWEMEAAAGAAGAHEGWQGDDTAGAVGDSEGGGSPDWILRAGRLMPRRELRSAGAAGDDEGGARPHSAVLDAVVRHHGDMLLALVGKVHPNDGAGASLSEEEEEREPSPVSVPSSSEERLRRGIQQAPWRQAPRYVARLQGMPWSAKERKRRRELSAEARHWGPTGAGGSCRHMVGARGRQADHFCGHCGARQKTAPAAAAGAAVDADGANEVAVGGSGSRACGSADAWWSTSPAGRAQPGAAAQRRGKWRRNSHAVRSRVKGRERGGRDCPQSADPTKPFGEDLLIEESALEFAPQQLLLSRAGTTTSRCSGCDEMLVARVAPWVNEETPCAHDHTHTHTEA